MIHGNTASVISQIITIVLNVCPIKNDAWGVTQVPLAGAGDPTRALVQKYETGQHWKTCTSTTAIMLPVLKQTIVTDAIRSPLES